MKIGWILLACCVSLMWLGQFAHCWADEPAAAAADKPAEGAQDGPAPVSSQLKDDDLKFDQFADLKLDDTAKVPPPSTKPAPPVFDPELEFGAPAETPKPSAQPPSRISAADLGFDDDVEARRTKQSLPPASQVNDADLLLPDSAEVFGKRGADRMTRGDFQGAISDFTTAIQIDSGYAPAYFLRGLSRLMLYRDADAQKDFDRYLEMSPSMGARVYSMSKQAKSMRQRMTRRILP